MEPKQKCDEKQHKKTEQSMKNRKKRARDNIDRIGTDCYSL